MLKHLGKEKFTQERLVQMQTAAFTNFARTYTSPKAFLPIIWVIISKDIDQYPFFVFFWEHLIKLSVSEMWQELLGIFLLPLSPVISPFSSLP